MKGNQKVRCFINIQFSSVIYAIIIYIGNYIYNYFFNIQVFGKLNFMEIYLQDIKINSIWLIHIILGFPLYIYGIYLIFITTIQNHKAQDPVTRKPIHLLTEGVYRKRRHPMYTGFVCAQAGLWFSLCSFPGYAIGSIVSIAILINSALEEKYELELIFKEQYINYKKQVQRRIFTKGLTYYLLCLLIIGIIGVITIR